MFQQLFKAICILVLLIASTWVAAQGNSSISVEVGDAPNAAVSYQLEELADELNHPSSIAFLPSGDYLITERNAGLTIVSDGIKIDVDNMPDIYVQRQAGLLDVALHPTFSRNQLIYFSYSHGDSEANGTRLSRAKLVISENGQEAELQDLEVLFTRMPMTDTALHYGGRIAFLPDRTLLLTLGEGFRYMDQAVKLDNHLGKIIRLHDDGSIPSNNPFFDTPGAKPEIVTYGHRNPQGLFVMQNGNVFVHEHGPRGGDEINLLQLGGNYGWPSITYGINYSGEIISPFSQKEGMQQSIVHYVPSIAPSGMTVYDGKLFPEWQGDLFVGGLVSMHVRRIDLEKDGSFGKQEKLFTELEARIRDVRTGPDGALYFVTDASEGKFYRVTPLSENN